MISRGERVFLFRLLVLSFDKREFGANASGMSHMSALRTRGFHVIVVRVYPEALGCVETSPGLFVFVPGFRAEHFNNFSDGRIPSLAAATCPVADALYCVALLESLFFDRHLLAGRILLFLVVFGFALLAPVYVFRDPSLLGHLSLLW